MEPWGWLLRDYLSCIVNGMDHETWSFTTLRKTVEHDPRASWCLFGALGI